MHWSASSGSQWQQCCLFCSIPGPEQSPEHSGYSDTISWMKGKDRGKEKGSPLGEEGTEMSGFVLPSGMKSLIHSGEGAPDTHQTKPMPLVMVYTALTPRLLSSLGLAAF